MKQELLHTWYQELQVGRACDSLPANLTAMERKNSKDVAIPLVPSVTSLGRNSVNKCSSAHERNHGS